MPARYRADLADVAWAKEHQYGVVPPTTEISALVTAGGTSTTGKLRNRWGLVTGGVDLPNPSFDWQPFYGLGVMNRNMLFPIQGRERLEGRIPQILLCHDASRMFLEQCIGLAFNAKNADSLSASNTTYSPTNAASGCDITATSFVATGDDLSGFTPNDGTTPPSHILIITENSTGTDPQRTSSTWAYIGQQYLSTAGFYVWKDQALTQAGWNGVRPLGGSGQRFSIHGIGVGSSALGASAGNNGLNITRDANQNKVVFIRPTLVQPSFTLGARFRADDGSNFITNYSGCKVSRTTFNFEEGAPVNFGADFIARDMSHNIGEHDSSGTGTATMKYKAAGTTGAHTLEPEFMPRIKVLEQPYFFSTVQLTFQGEPIARFRRFTISIDNGLDPRYYITQNDSTSPRDNRQVIHEILEGRRTISFGGSLDLDDDGSNAYPASTSPTDAQFLRYLLNQGMTSTDIRDQDTLRGIGITVELRQVNDFSANTASPVHNKIKFILPSNGTGNYGSEDEVGMVLRTAPHNVPAPPSVHVPVDIDGMCSSMHIEIYDGVSAAT